MTTEELWEGGFLLSPGAANPQSRRHLERVIAMLPRGRFRGDGPALCPPNDEGYMYPIWMLNGMQVNLLAPDAGDFDLRAIAHRDDLKRIGGPGIDLIERGFFADPTRIVIQRFFKLDTPALSFARHHPSATQAL